MAHCAFCHMAAGVVGPDIRASATLADGRAWNAIVGEGALAKRGMVGWSSVMTPDEIQSIRAYFINEAQAYKAQQDKARPDLGRVQ
jgi:mono/diheme cytochrome c family protein